MTFGLIASVSSMAGVTTGSARRIAKTAAHRYKIFQIPKRNGGIRIVAQPAREVKALQRALIECLSPELPVHSAATAYSKGNSIKGNAERHLTARFLLKLDFSNFFPSIGQTVLDAHLSRHMAEKLSDVERSFAVDLVVWRGQQRERCLCIGAPSSPFLSNSVMFEFDDRVSTICREVGVEYTRYSDDLTFSAPGPDILNSIEGQVRQVCADIAYPRLSFNERKRVSVGRSTALHITGLTLANQGFVSVGRKRKRGVRAGVLHYIKGLLDEEQQTRLRGEVAFVLSVEPAFRQVLVNSYGAACLPVLPKID